MVSHTKDSGRLDRTFTVSEIRKVASRQVSVVSHPEDSGHLDRTFTVSEPRYKTVAKSFNGVRLQRRTELTK